MPPPYTSPLARARVAPRVRSCDRRIQMLCGGAGGRPRRARSSGRTAHLLSPPACVVPQGVPQGRGRAPREGYSRDHGAGRLCFSSPHPAPVAEGCYSPTSLPAFLAPPAPPHTRRFLGGSLDARLLSRCAPASLQMRANAVSPILLLLNIGGARGLVPAPVAPLMRRTHFRQRPVVELAKLPHTSRTSRRIVMQVAEPPCSCLCSSFRSSFRPTPRSAPQYRAPRLLWARWLASGWRPPLPVLLSTRPFCSAVPRTRSRRTHVSGSARAIPCPPQPCTPPALLPRRRFCHVAPPSQSAADGLASMDEVRARALYEVRARASRLHPVPSPAVSPAVLLSCS